MSTQAEKATNHEVVPLLVFDTHSTNEHYNGDCDYGYVPLTKAVWQILKRMDRAKELHSTDRELMQLEYSDCSVSFFAHPSEYAFPDAAAYERFEDMLERITGDEHYEIVEDGSIVVPDALIQRTEMDRQLINAPGYDLCVWWSASPKHSDVTVEGVGVPRSIIEKYA